MLIFMQLILLVSVQAFAQECPAPKRLNDILSCLKENHYLIQVDKFNVNETRRLGETLGRRPNPILGIETAHGKDSSKQTQVTLSQELDLGGKLSSLKKQGQVTHELVKNKLLLTREDIIQTVLLNLHHYLHIKETLLIDYKVKNSLERVISKLDKRPALNPEQEISKQNFKKQLSEVGNKIFLLEDLQEELLVFFIVNGGYSRSQLVNVMKGEFHTMELKEDYSAESFKLDQIGLRTKLATQELKFEEGRVWEGVSIGAVFMDEKMDGFNEKLYGIGITIPIPLWQTNQAGKAQATLKLENAKRKYSLLKKKENLEKETLLVRIEKLKKHLRGLPSESELTSDYVRSESLYSKGLIAPYTYLDSLRMWREITASRLELEEKILQLSIDYYKRIGKLIEVKL